MLFGSGLGRLPAYLSKLRRCKALPIGAQHSWACNTRWSFVSATCTRTAAGYKPLTVSTQIALLRYVRRSRIWSGPPGLPVRLGERAPPVAEEF
jgi:hypothetical protein